jgi:hypothetical protein
MGTINGTTHMKMFSFLPGIGEHFIINALCGCDDCHAVHSHFTLFHDNAFYKPPEEEIQRSQIWRMRRTGNGLPSVYPSGNLTLTKWKKKWPELPY